MLFGLIVSLSITFGYLTADPVDPNNFGLATQTGRYAVTLDSACTSTFTVGQNVTIYDEASLDSDPTVVQISTDSGSPCSILSAIKMSDVMCFTNDANQCDVAGESD